MLRYSIGYPVIIMISLQIDGFKVFQKQMVKKFLHGLLPP